MGTTTLIFFFFFFAILYAIRFQLTEETNVCENEDKLKEKFRSLVKQNPDKKNILRELSGYITNTTDLVSSVRTIQKNYAKVYSNRNYLQTC